jgi:chitinase
LWRRRQRERRQFNDHSSWPPSSSPSAWYYIFIYLFFQILSNPFKQFFSNEGPSPRFAPYFDVMIKGSNNLTQIYTKTGQKDFTLAFVLGSTNGCDPKWGAERELNDTEIIDDIRAVQEKGGQMIVALGGAIGPYLEHLCTSVESLASAYKNILDVVKTNHLDIDVEAPINMKMVNQALAKVQKERPGTTVSFTLMVQAEDYGLNPELGLKMIQSAKENGVHVDIVNPMTMGKRL